VAQHGLPGEAWDGIDSRQALNAALAEIRERGYCEATPKQEVRSMAAPITDGQGLLAGAVGLYFPLFRRGPASRRRFVAELIETAARISALL
jgi:DNA-binding IclR family transcriptional regulator